MSELTEHVTKLPWLVELCLRIFFATMLTMMLVMFAVWVYDLVGAWVFAPFVLVFWLFAFSLTTDD